MRVQTLEEFREQIHNFSVEAIFCLFTADPQGKPPVGMRLYFYHGANVYYLFDYASGERLTVTGIPVSTYGSHKEPYISEDDVKSFISKEFAGKTVSFERV